MACAREVYGSIGPAFYGLRTKILALLLMALPRIKRPEALKQHSPDGLGRLLGLDRAPGVKTLRRKLRRLAVAGRAADLGRALAKRRIALHGSAVGLLYLDGRVRVYHGRHALPKAHIARMSLALPATTDYWVLDACGEPLFVVTVEANAGLVKMLPAAEATPSAVMSLQVVGGNGVGGMEVRQRCRSGRGEAGRASKGGGPCDAQHHDPAGGASRAP